MRIAVLSSHTPSLFWFRIDMMLSFQRCGYEVVALGNEAEEIWKEKFLEKGIRYIQVDIQRNATNPLKDLGVIKSLRKVLKEVKPDKIFAFQAKTVIYGSIAARTLGITEVYPLIAGLGSVFLKDGLKSKLLQWVLKAEYRVALNGAKKVFFQNPDDVEFYVSNKIVSKEKIVMINGSGVNLKNFLVSPLPAEPAFLCIGRLIRDKGIVEYLEAAKNVKKIYPDIRFILVGPYDTNPSAIKKEELKSYIDDGVVEYFGEQSDVRPFIDQCSIFVLPSYREGTPKTVLEAMACGRAIITSDAPGCRETVENGVNGYLVPIKDVDSLTEKMIELISDRECVERMGSNGRRVVESKYDVDLVNNVICNAMSL